MRQGVLPFYYEPEPTESGITALGGLPAYLELAIVSGLPVSIERHLGRLDLKEQGWTDIQVIMSLILLNLAGGESIDDLRILEQDEGLVKVLKRTGFSGHPRKERREQQRRWRKEKKRTFPSPPAVFRYLSAFVNEAEESKRAMGKAYIPAPNEALKGLSQVNTDVLRFARRKMSLTEATLEMDATIVATTKQDAFYSYKGNQSFQPLSIRWAEADLIVHSEFRDGNVPAAYQDLRVFKEALGTLPGGVIKVYLKSDTAAYEKDLLRYCAEGKSERFGIIEFAIGAMVTKEFKDAVAGVKEEDWHPLEREIQGRKVPTGQEWAEVCFVPTWVGLSKNSPDYRYLAIREHLTQRELPGMEGKVPFPTMNWGEEKYKLFGLVTNRDIAGDELIWWSRQRCGKGEEMHAIMKNDLAGGRLPSSQFGANAAWWQIMILAFNLNSLMKHLALPENWETKRLKAIRFGVINLAGRVVDHSRQLYIRINGNHPAYAILLEVRRRLRMLFYEREYPVAPQGAP